VDGVAHERWRGEVRLTDAEREHTAERLHKAFRDGRISLDELDGRLGLVYAADTAAGLAAPLADLPSHHEEQLLADEVLELDAGGRRVTWSGPWTVPRRLRVRQDVDTSAVVVLDFTAARVRHPVVDLELQLGAYGTAHLVLPPGGTADLTRVTGRGRPARTDVPTEGTPHALHLVVTGRAPRRNAVRAGYRRHWWWSLIQ
jgi:hypothetical protein